VAAIVETTEPTAAPIRVPATPRDEAATAEVTAASAPPKTWVRLRPPAGFSSVRVVVAGRVDVAERESGMTPKGDVDGAGRNSLWGQRTSYPMRSRHAPM